MKLFHRLHVKLYKLGAIALFCAAIFGARNALANPFASFMTVSNSAGVNYINFYLNEGGGSVTVTYEDGTTNTTYDGVSSGSTNVAAGPHTFSMNGHAGYTITCHKLGTGTPFQINPTTGSYYTWGTPRGLDADKNPKIGRNFGRVYTGESTASGSGATFRGRGIYMLTPDLSTNLAPAGGTNPCAVGVFAQDQANSLTTTPATTAAANGPIRIYVGPDDVVYVADNDYTTSNSSTNNSTLYAFDPTFSVYTNVVLGPVGETGGLVAGVHGAPTSAYVTGSLANSNLVLYTFDQDLPISYAAALWFVDSGGNPIYHTGSEGITIPGFYNNIYQYNIGAGPLPWTNAPTKGVSIGLPSFPTSIAAQIGSVLVEPNGYTIAEFNRLNFSDGNIQVYDTNFNLVYTSLQPNGTDPFNATSFGEGYAGIQISPDGQYLMTVNIDNQIVICFLTNGIPDISSYRAISTASAVGNSRGCAFDAAQNVLLNSSGAGNLQYWSLGYSSTCVSSNDITGTNGTFFFSQPPISASLTISQPNASQNGINNSTPGTPIPAVFNINLNTNYLAVGAQINFTLTGNGTNVTNFKLNTGTNADGVFITNSYVIFPATNAPGGGNWTVAITVTPTASPLSGPTFTESVAIAGGTTYIPAEPFSGSFFIINTGPQQLVLSAAAIGTTMSRGVTNDYASFIITRLGDSTASAYTVTNFNYGGTAVFHSDFTAGAQNAATPPSDGSPGILITPGTSVFTNIIGNPVPRSNIYQQPTNVTVILSLTNSVTGFSGTSLEGVAYTVTTNTVTLTELDNTVGPEVVLWSDPMTNVMDSTNWTLTFSTPLLNATHTVLPVLITTYTNNISSVDGGGTNDFSVLFGNSVTGDGLPVSPVMAANGWTTALKASVENNLSSPAGVNVFPQGMNFQGNYGLRFSMYLRLYDRALANKNYNGVNERQFALFGINNKGTNCDWRPTFAVANTLGSTLTGSGATNWDGTWFAINAGIDTQTPADFDALASPALPNSGGADLVSNTGETLRGAFKVPPFDGIKSLLGTLGGEPVDQWVDVSVETTMRTNVQLYVNQTKVLSSFVNPVTYTNGTIMLGYENPLPNISDSSAYVYFSNVRVIELSPYITVQPASVILTNNQNVTFPSTATFATAPLTNIWYTGGATALTPIQTNTVAGTNMSSSLVLTNVQGGTNYFTVYSDTAGSVTGLVVNLEVIKSPTSVTAVAGSIVTFSVTPSGLAAPTLYGWKHAGTNLINSSVYAGVTNATLTITNVQVSTTYTCGVTNAAGSVLPSVSLTVVPPNPPVVATPTIVGTNTVILFSSSDPNAAPATFKLLSSLVVTGPYVTNAAAVITGTNGSYQIVVPTTTNATIFYRLEDIY